jgi:hypothetical protein
MFYTSLRRGLRVEGIEARETGLNCLFEKLNGNGHPYKKTKNSTLVATLTGTIILMRDTNK